MKVSNLRVTVIIILDGFYDQHVVSNQSQVKGCLQPIIRIIIQACHRAYFVYLACLVSNLS